jgi:hypothetical protein
MDKYPVIEKTVALTEADYHRLLRSNNINNGISDSILDLLIKAHTKIEDRKIAMWDQIAQDYFGLKNHLEATRQGKCIEISWANMQINLRSQQKEAT